LLQDVRTVANYEPFIQDFVQDPRILDMASRIKHAWKQPFRFRQQVLRTNVPHAYRCATRVHYDQM
jgi:phytanoyl-CoA hydroxylase